ncbi:MAG: 3-hydroxyacyl-[acyl-carrier-protein] dehydratase FabZ [Desulfovibrionales bacterium]|nr:MAG: 3-hydroxyacyl-[acyl-carrier-protein] dehydratase FabZ [Desulfovibrionales bacterium]
MSSTNIAPIDIRGIMELLPHRYPFLLVDRVLEFEPLVSIRAIKNVSFNEPFFQGHFPGYPLMPGVLIIEALAQTAGLLLLMSKPKEELKNKLFLFTGLERVKFRRQVVPGDQLELDMLHVKNKMNVWKMDGSAKVNGNLVAEASLSGAFVDREQV